MLIQQKTGNLSSFHIGNRDTDFLDIQWYETGKRIMHKRSRSGQQIILKFMGDNQKLTQDDILYHDEKMVLLVNIMPCRVIVIRPENMFEMASVCYEIGNKHLPLFFGDEEVLVAFEEPLFRLMSASGYQVELADRKLINPLNTTVVAHEKTESGTTLFSRIMKLNNPST